MKVRNILMTLAIVMVAFLSTKIDAKADSIAAGHGTESDFHRNVTLDLNGGTASKAYWSTMLDQEWGMREGEVLHNQALNALEGCGNPNVTGGTFYERWNTSTVTPYIEIEGLSKTGYSLKSVTYGDYVQTGYHPGANWYWDSSRGTLLIEVGCYINGGNDTTLTVEWKANKYNIKYYPNGGEAKSDFTMSDSSYHSQSVTYNSSYTIKNGKNMYTKEGYTFKGWNTKTDGSGTNYSSGDTGTWKRTSDLKLYAKWADETNPSISSFSATPTSWSAGNGTVTLKARDKGSGISKVELYRYSDVTKQRVLVKTFTHSSDTSQITDIYIETAEGVFNYAVFVYDASGNVSGQTSNFIYLDHSNPVLTSKVNTNTQWTNVAPTIKYGATDYLAGTTYNGSGVESVSIYNDRGVCVSTGGVETSYTLCAADEGVHTFTIKAKDKVGHVSSATVTTRYDITPVGIDGGDNVFVPNADAGSGYTIDNIIRQHTDDAHSRSTNGANASSGLKSVTFFKVVNGRKIALDTSSTKKDFTVCNEANAFDLYYDGNADLEDKELEYFLVIATDFAGNVSTKKIMTQANLLHTIHTSIDRSTYEG